ncbi:Uncharacterized protein APZ42_015732 [Daphnia magna]|uniref:Uncharacterized protein n=1 Tax=Daphnia magna TaxID=35525 RepID=A0A162NPU3_9CRUS|nr:Uncharacterized protein APZ42_015732 [Daphnia magna]
MDIIIWELLKSDRKEPEGERSGLPDDQSEDLGTADLVDPGHPAVEPLPSQPESSDGVDGTSNPAETSDVYPTSVTPRTDEEDSDIVAIGIRPDSNLCIVRETVPDIPAERREERHLHLSIEVKELSIHLEKLLLVYQKTFLADLRNLILHLRELRLLTPLEPLAPQIKSLLRKLDNFPGANNTEQRTASREDPTDALPNQDTTETIPTVEHCGRGNTAVRCPTASTTAGGESCSTTKTGAIRRPPPYSAISQSAPDPTLPYADSITQERGR